MNNKSLLREHTGIIIICIVFLTAGFLRLNDLSILNPDSSRYLIWGNSIAHGNGFVDDTQPEPEGFVIQAPLYPILIAPIEFIFPLSQFAVKIWTLLWGCVLVILFYLWLNKILGKISAIVGTIILASNPLLLIYSTEVLSDAPFLALVLLVFLVSEKYLSSDVNTPLKFFTLIASVTSVMMLREAGIALVMAVLVFYFYMKQWKIASLIALSTLIFWSVWYLRNNVWLGPLPPQMQGGNMNLITQHFFTPPDAPLMNELAIRLWEKSNEYFFQFSGMLIYPLYMSQQFRLNIDPSAFHQSTTVLLRTFGKFAVLALTIPLILFGIYLDVQKSKTSVLRLLFGVFYLGLIFFYPAHDVRFLLPVLPLIIFYCILSIKWLAGKIKLTGENSSPKFVILAILILMLPNLSGIYEILKINLAYRNSPVKFFERVRQLPTYPLMFTQPWSLMGKWICDNLPDTVVLASPQKELSTVVGNRKVLELDQSSVLPTFENLLRDNHVDYILTTIRREDFKIFEFFMMESRRTAFEPVYSVANLHLMKVRSKLREYLSPDTSAKVQIDTVSATQLLRRGRMELLDEHYADASRLFKKALAIDSTLPEIYYQTIVAYAMMGDSVNAGKYYEKLFTLPQALGYVGNARMQIQAMRLLAKAQTETFQPGRAVGAYNVASLYWKIGYYKRAASIMDLNFGLTDSTYLMGLLWGLHFNLQNGDTGKAKQYLSILQKLDSSNAVVKAFKNILIMGDSLQSAQSPIARSSLHWEIGVQYKLIELNEEAIDEAERALRDDPKNLEAYILMAQMFERKSNLRMTNRIYSQALFVDPGNIFIRAKLDSVQREFSKR